MDMRRLVERNALRIRLSKDLTQEEFAERSGFSQQYISDLERGWRNPTVVTVFELTQALGVSHLDLLQPEAGDNRPSPVKPNPPSETRPHRPAKRQPLGRK